MNKDGMLSELKNTISGIKLPKHVGFELHHSILYIHLSKDDVVCNMQTDRSAFEGWMFCLRAYLPINEVELSWEKPAVEIAKKESMHYNRFLLRVLWCCDNYTWFHVHEKDQDEINAFREKHATFVMNYPTKGSSKKAHNSEHELERAILRILPQPANHQLPVGLFDQAVRAENSCTPSKASQIDLWQIQDDTFRVFELKIENNTQVGIISELMYYTNVFHHLFKTQHISYENDTLNNKKTYHRGFEHIINALKNKNIQTVVGVFLAENLHTLFASKKDTILKDLNNNRSNIVYQHEPVSKYIAPTENRH